MNVAIAAENNAAAAPSAKSDPGKAAIAYLDALRSRKPKSKWLGLTGISRFTSAAKRKELVQRIESLAARIHPDLPFSVEAAKVSKNLAGVVLSQYSPQDPAGPRLFGVAMVRREGRWLPTPSPGTFENTLYGYDRDQSRRAAEIESWLLHERATRAADIQQRALESLRKRMLARLPADQHEKLSPKEVAHRFIDACVARDVDAALALAGGLSDPLPRNWDLRRTAISKALDKTPDQIDRPWRLVAAPEVARAILMVERETRRSTTITIGCLDPAATNPSALADDLSTPPILVPLQVVRSENGCWHVNPPKFLLEAPRKRTRPFEPDWIEKLIDHSDPDLIEQFPEKFRKEHPPITTVRPDELRPLLLKALNSGKFPELLRMAAPSPNNLVSLTGYERLATIWRALHGKGRVGTAIFLGSLVAPETTAMAFNIFTAQQPETARVVVVRTLRNPEGAWSLAPGVLDIKDEPIKHGEDAGPEDKEDEKRKNGGGPPPSATDPLAGRIAEAMPKWKTSAPEASIAAAERLDGLPATPPPTPEQAAAAVREWREELMEGDIPDAIRTTAIFNFKKSTARFLRALGHEWIGIERTRDPGKVVAAGNLGHWAAVTLRVEGPDGPSFPFYVVVSGKGPARVLPEIDLFQNGNRTRRFLNKTTWRQLREEWPWPRETLDELEKLFNRQKENLAKPTSDDSKKS